MHSFARLDHVLFNAVNNSLCVALKKIYESIEFIIALPYHIAHSYNQGTSYSMIHKSPRKMHAFVPWRYAVKKINMPKVFVVTLKYLFYVVWYENIQFIVFWNEEDLLDRLIITFINFIVKRNYCFCFDVPLLFLSFLLLISTLFQIIICFPNGLPMDNK